MSTADLSNVKSLSIDGVNLKKLLVNGVYVWAKYDNWVPLSTEANSYAIYNGNLGYKEGYRLSSNGSEKTQEGSVTTGFIPAKPGDVVRMAGVNWGTTVQNGYSYILFYGPGQDGPLTKLANLNRFKMADENGVSNHSRNIDKAASSIMTDEDGVTTFNVVFNTVVNYTHIRISATGKGADMIVTVNREIP